MKENRIGIEAEYILMNEKGKVVIPPSYLDRDDYPLLGEIRGEPGENISETISNFWKAYYIVKESLPSNYTMVFSNKIQIDSNLHKEVLTQVTKSKGKGIGKVKNIYGTDIDRKSSLVVKHGNIMGVNVSCGLHIHFSCGEKESKQYKEYEYESVVIPIHLSEVTGKSSTLKELINPEIYLYRRKYSEETKKEIEVLVSTLNKPTIEYIIKKLDDNLLNEFIPSKTECTKFREKGYYELKEYGFEYRSFPANDKILTPKSLYKVISFAFELLDECSI